MKNKTLLGVGVLLAGSLLYLSGLVLLGKVRHSDDAQAEVAAAREIPADEEEPPPNSRQPVERAPEPVRLTAPTRRRLGPRRRQFDRWMTRWSSPRGQ